MFIHELKDLYNAENQLIKALPKVIKTVNDEGLKRDISAHLNETKQHAARIEKIMKEMEMTPNGVKCKGMEGLVEEGDEVIKEKKLPKDVVTDALVTGAQKIEQYEIHAYESAIKAAQELGHQHAVEPLQQSLREERAAYEKLHSFSQSH
jgi:ferritin-like metal-binding protein YciE